MLSQNRVSLFQTILQIIYLVAVIYYLFNGDILFDFAIIATGIGAFFSPITYFVLIGVGVFTDYNIKPNTI